MVSPGFEPLSEDVDDVLRPGGLPDALRRHRAKVQLGVQQPQNCDVILRSDGTGELLAERLGHSETLPRSVVDPGNRHITSTSRPNPG
jgi:hypothetical protein